MLAARGAPTTSTELAAIMGTSKQAASKLVDTMESAGYVRREVASDDGRSHPVVLTRRGERLLAAVEEIYVELEQEWEDIIGAARVRSMRGDLVRVLRTGDDGALPPVRPTW